VRGAKDAPRAKVPHPAFGRPLPTGRGKEFLAPAGKPIGNLAQEKPLGAAICTRR